MGIWRFSGGQDNDGLTSYIFMDNFASCTLLFTLYLQMNGIILAMNSTI